MRDPAQGVISWFAALMACVGFVALTGVGLLAWGAWRLVRHLVGG
jgi:hypothetical protein